MARLQVIVCCVCLFALSSNLPVRADMFDPAFAKEDVDAKASKTWQDPDRRGTFHQLMAFHKPVSIGSIVSTKRVQRYLKPDAPYPGDPKNDDHWVTLDVPPYQSHVRLVTFPHGVRTRALWLTGVRRRGQSDFARFFARRLHNVTPLALAQAEKDYGAGSGARITKGTGAWQNTGPVGLEGIVPGEPISEFAPTWFILSWDTPQRIVGIYSQDNFSNCKFEVFVGPRTADPLLAHDKDADWERPALYKEEMENGRWITFPSVKTRGIRIRIISTAHPQIARISAMLVFTDLGKAPVPAMAVRKAEPPPFSVPYSTGLDGIFTMVFNDPDGRRVKNIVARARTPKGDHEVPWDLKDEQGRVVPVGTYKWKGIAGPPIELRYQMCPYPNVSMHTPDNPPWECGSRGGWLADHNPEWGVTTLADRVYVGATGHEAGAGFIGCTLEGKKLWQIRRGTRRMMAYGEKYIFCENGPWDGSRDSVWVVDVENHRITPFFSRSDSDQRKRGIRGMTPLNGKLYLTVSGDKRWLVRATNAGAVDMPNCLPIYEPGEARSGPTANLSNDFLRVFRLRGSPPGKWGLTHLESTKGRRRKQHTLLAFKEPVPIGSLAFAAPEQEDIGIKIRVLKPGSPYPPNPNDDTQWAGVCTPGQTTWDVTAVPIEVPETRALLITFSKGGEDELADLLESEDDKIDELDELLGLGEEDEKRSYIGYERKGEWRGLLEGMTLLRRRYKNLFDSATIHVNSGTLFEDGTWDAQRAQPISPDRPGIYAMEWQQPQKIRGLAIKEIDGRITRIDVWTGPDGQPVDVDGFDHWEQVATYTQKLRSYSPYGDNYNGEALYIDGYADFGKEITTRAVRLRVTEQWTSRAQMRGGVRSDRGGTTPGPCRCRVYGVAPLQYLGGGPPADPLLAERIEVWDIESKKLERELHFKDAQSGYHNGLVPDPDGELFATQGSKIVKLDLENGEHEDFVTDCGGPLAMAFDNDGNFYVYDAQEERRVIRVYDPKGKYQRTIGTPGGKKRGAWDPLQFSFVTGMAVDKDNNLWVVDWNYYPKRSIKMTRDGKVLGEFYGVTNYGGNGTIDPWDKTRVFYGALEFEVNYETGATRLKNLLWQGPANEHPQICIRIDDRNYMVNRPIGYQAGMAVGIVYLFEKDHVEPVAAFGGAGSFSGLTTVEMRKALGKRILDDYDFIWADRNGDGQVQYEEVEFLDKKGAMTMFNRDLGAQGAGFRYQVKEFLPGGVPAYERVESPIKKGIVYRYDSGTGYHRMDEESGYNAEGELTWTYPSEGMGTHAIYYAGPWHTGHVVAQFGWIGNETAHAGDLGEFVVSNSNSGAWHIWTSDGLLAAYLLKDMRSPGARWWTMWEHDRNMLLKNITAGQEHFSGYFCRSMKDNKYYIIMGGSSVNVAEVIGIDKFKRYEGTFRVEPENVRKVLEWELTRVREARKSKRKMYDCYPARRITIDGSTSEWPEEEGVSMYSPTEESEQAARFWAAFDNNYLYLCYQASGMGPFINSGRLWDMLFKTGAAVDFQVAAGSETNPNRKEPEKGDERLLMSTIDGEPVAVLYRPVAPNAPPEDRWEVASPVFRFQFDQAKQLKDVRMAFSQTGGQFVFEAAVPLSTLGIKIRNNLLLKMDWGILQTDENGTRVIKRSYWSNKATAVLSDAPSEARLHPDLWGYIRFIKKRTSKMEELLDPSLLEPDYKDEGEVDDSMFDIF